MRMSRPIWHFFNWSIYFFFFMLVLQGVKSALLIRYRDPQLRSEGIQLLHYTYWNSSTDDPLNRVVSTSITAQTSLFYHWNAFNAQPP